MSDILNCINKYIAILGNEKFVAHQKTLSKRLQNGIKNGYVQKDREENIVKITEEIVNTIGTFSSGSKDPKIFTNSVFIHGSKSKVEFEYYEKETKRELGDIIFILSIVYNNKKYFEKITINQVKKSNEASWGFYNDSSKEQLYLLSRFPTFKGSKNSLVPAKQYNLLNYSGCLGTHGLLYPPGDFALVSSKVLSAILSNRNSFTLRDIVSNCAEEYFPSFCLYPCTRESCDFDECLHLCYRLTHYIYNSPAYIGFCLSACPVLGNSCIAYNSYDFSDKYLRGLIGEMDYAKDLPFNHSIFKFLQDLLKAIKAKAVKEGNEKILNFIESFYSYKYANGWEYKGPIESNYEGGINYEGGGIGIVHTTINLGGREL